MDGSRIVILGGGMVAGYAAKELAERGLKTGELAILSSDTALPYERPPLSKGFLAGKETDESVLINSADFYREHGIDARLGCEVTAIDPLRRRLTIKDGGDFAFEKLIVATGARARRLTLPGSDIDNILYLRSLGDSKKIRDRLSAPKRAVVIGGGFIGMEVASVMASKQIETTMILREDRVWKQFFTPEMSRFFEDYFAARGVVLVREATIARFRGDGPAAIVELVDGRAIPCDLIVAGVGAIPALEIFAKTGVEITNGAVVNEYLETSESSVMAAGDLANYPDLLFEKRRRVEHWDNAVSQGQYCARRLTGDHAPFRHVPYFFSDVFDLSYEFWGDTASTNHVVVRGEISSSSFSVWWLRDEIVRAAFVMNRPAEEREAAPGWIENSERMEFSVKT